MSNIHIIVICASDERKQFQKKQFATLQLPYDVTYIGAYTPDTSIDYINDSDETYPESSYTMCCTRSHAAAIDWYVRNSESPYGLFIEDDVCLLKDAFVAKVESLLQTWSRHNDVDYVSLGYLPAGNGLPCDAKNVDDMLHWNPMRAVWGTQAYIVSHKKAFDMAQILHQPTSKQVRFLAKSMIDMGHKYSFRHLRLQSDVLLPVLFRQGFVTPMMAIESPFTSIITNENMARRWIPAVDAGTVDPSLYYGTPNFNLITEK